MAITEKLYNGRYTTTMAKYEAIETLEENVDYELIDYPKDGITNSQMTFALTCTRLFPVGTTFVCIDNTGTYLKGHTYKIIISNSIKQWEDISLIDETSAKTDEQNSFDEPNIFKEHCQFDKGLSSDKNINITNSALKMLDNTTNGDGTNKDVVTQYKADTIIREINNTVYTYSLPNKTGTFATSEDLEGKINVAEQNLVNRVYVRTEVGTDTTLPFTYTAEGNSIAHRNASGQLQTETPSQKEDAANKEYVDAKSQKYLSLSGESGTLDDNQYALVTGYDNLIIQRSGVDFKRCGYPSNGQGNYIYITPYYASANGSEEFDAYVITIKQDKTWEFKLKNFLEVAGQSYAPIVTLTPDSATNGTLEQDDFENLTQHDDVKIKLNNEYYILMDDGHTEGLMSYIHEGWNGSSNQVKSINITKATKAWTLVVGETQYYKHYIQLSIGDKTIYYDFTSTKGTAYTASTLPAMPDNTISSLQLLANGRYSIVSGLIYRNGENLLKAIVHGMYTTDGSNMTYLVINGDDATFISDTVSKL